jgi:hypothetical protein
MLSEAALAHLSTFTYRANATRRICMVPLTSIMREKRTFCRRTLENVEGNRRSYLQIQKV